MTKGKRGPVPGSKVRGSTTGRPVMAALDMLGRRWALRVLFELSTEPAGFRELQGRCEKISASVLNTRLHELQEATVVELRPDGKWHLSALGAELMKAVGGLRAWSTKWAEALGTEL
jgi:DNA-binding HxlR family transcriptional regulator